MIAHWFQRELGQIVAPDPELTKPDSDGGGGSGDVVDVDIDDVDESDDLLQILAPDPIYLEKVRKHHHHHAKQSEEEGARASLPIEDTMVECIHCHQLTPGTRMAKTHRHDASPVPSSSVSGTAQYATPSSKLVPAPASTSNEPATDASSTYIFSPPPQQRQTISNANTSFASQQLDDLVLSAVKDTAKTLTSNESYWELTKNFFTWCASSEPLTAKQVKKLQKALKNEPELANARSVEMKFVPDGFTPLHAAALVGREEVARILIDFEVEDDVDYNYKEQQQEEQEKGEKSDFPNEMKQGETKEPRPTMAEKENKDTDSVVDQKKDIQDENESRKQATEQTRTDQDKDSTNNNNNNNNNNIASKNTKSKVKKMKKAVSLYTRDNQGRTPLHIAAERGHLHLVRLLLDAMTIESSSPPQSLDNSSNNNNNDNNDMSFASPDGKMIEIKQRGVPPLGKDAPVDLAGRTPLGWAVTSRNASARKNRIELEQVLFSPGDKSICGAYTPAKDRGGGTQRRRAWTTGGGKKSRSRRSIGSSSNTRGGVDHNSGGVLQLHGVVDEATMEDAHTTEATRGTLTRNALLVSSSSRSQQQQPLLSSTLLSSSMELTYGFSEMPGFRIEMEDAMCYHYPLSPPSCTDKWIALFGVFDGHGDGGLASQYVSRNIANVLCSTTEYKHYVGGVNALARGLIKTCMEIDDDLKRMKFRKHGGTTAVLTIITEEVVIVGNVGDCRCILVQRPSVNNTSPNDSGVGNAKGRGQLVGGQDVPSLVDDLGKMTIEEKRDVGVGLKEKGNAGERKTEEKEASAGEGTTNQEEMEVDGATQDKDGKAETEEEEKISSGPKDASSPTPLEITTKGEHASVDLSNDGQDKQVSSTSARRLTAAPESGIVVTALSEDHKPNLPDERIRIEKAGMDVVPDIFRDTLSSSSEGTGGDDVDEEGTLTTIWKIRKSKTDMIAVSRAFGDFDYKDNPNLKANEQAIIAAPDIRIHMRDDEHDMFLVLACDGIWDVMSNDEVGAFVTNKFQEMLLASSTNNVDEETEKSLEIIPTVCDELINECFRRGSRDNMSVLIVALPQAYVVDEKDDDSERDSYGHVDDARRSLNFSDE